MSAIRTDVVHATGPIGTQEAVLANKVSWGAILAGVTIALASQVTLVLVGAGIGAASLDLGNGAAESASSSLPIGAAVWSVGSVLVSTFLGAYVAARLSGRTAPASAGLHGLTTWAVTTLLVLYLLTTSVGAILGGAFSGVSSLVGGVGRTVAETAAPALAEANPLEAIENQVRSTGSDPEALQANAVNAIRSLLTGGGADAGRQAADALAQAKGIPVEEATRQVAEIERQYRATLDDARQKASQAAEATASVVSKGALGAAAALVLGALAGWFGGRSGRVAAAPRRL
ncbi:hypothetical protein [Aurantimonas sp. Leaf443]|uniref:hypothetical protein n=1 Tax=Aurantimonas sp. Leaf443 TaxID=1736378 RepID=UPI0006F6BFD2|nr:hypothetical protein [Aurantimonas sp. Leaf443]KQT88345.1 hypothetical protein ASG48_02660 [Aurantimonas sp. Leaf443]